MLKMWVGLSCLCAAGICSGQNIIDVTSFGIEPGQKKDASAAFQKMADTLALRTDTEKIVISFPKGRYDFYPDSAAEREYYISNHDQDNPKRVGMACENLNNVVIEGNGSDFYFHGRMLPLSLLNSKDCELRNFSIDFVQPHIVQLDVQDVNPQTNDIVAKVDSDRYKIENGCFIRTGEGWSLPPGGAIAFDGSTRHLYYRMSDIGYSPSKVEEITPGLVKFYGWLGNRVQKDAKLALRGWHRPTPGIFLSHSDRTVLKNVTVHYSEGMGLLAQMCADITMNGFKVALRGQSDPRYFTAQADATHFSGCKGKIISENGLYEGMMDDAINVHGTYLKVVKRINDKTLIGRYMHGQSWGFEWGRAGDAVQIVESVKMETVMQNRVKAIRPHDQKTWLKVREIEIEFEDALPESIHENAKYGIENLTWTPEVVFRHNVVRNNRARGALFSTPRKVVVEKNFFDHTNGTAILLCGDCNGWYETGACSDVLIRENRFLNALTSEYQFTNAVISIYPEIPDLKGQTKYFHRNIVIEKNLFETFDKPILYAKSVDGLRFTGNKIKKNTDFKPYHRNQKIFFFERVKNVLIENNVFPSGTDLKSEIRVELSSPDAVRCETK